MQAITLSNAGTENVAEDHPATNAYFQTESCAAYARSQAIIRYMEIVERLPKLITRLNGRIAKSNPGEISRHICDALFDSRTGVLDGKSARQLLTVIEGYDRDEEISAIHCEIHGGGPHTLKDLRALDDSKGKDTSVETMRMHVTDRPVWEALNHEALTSRQILKWKQQRERKEA